MDAIMDNHISIPSLLLGAVVLYVLYTAAVISRKNARILRLGARAPIRPKYAPWGLDFVYDYVGYALKDQMYEMWVIMYQKWAGPNHYTIEAGASRRMIFTAEPENIKAILATQFKEYGKGEQFRKDWHAFLGDGIFTTDGQLWHNSRQLIRPQFIKDRLSNIEVFEEHVQILLSMIGHKQEVDTLDLMFRYTLDIATHFLLGHSVNSLQNPESTFAEAFSNAQRVQVIVQKLGFVALCHRMIITNSLSGLSIG
jgi:cytochrome P450